MTRVGSVADTWFLRGRAAVGWPGLTVSLDEVATVPLFVGHVKSGGSLVGAMLDAHPEIVIGDEVDVARLMRAKVSGDAMLAEFVLSSRREAMGSRVTARRLGGYSLEVRGWSQGASDRPRVIGNSRPGPTTRYLGGDPDTLAAVIDVFSDRRVVFLHVIRRPHDSIAAMVLRSGRDVVNAARDHAGQCERLAWLRRHLGESVHSIHYEALIDDCPGTLGRVLGFLGVQPPTDYLRACSNLVDDNLVPESARVAWNEVALEIAETSIHSFDFLAPYRE